MKKLNETQLKDLSARLRERTHQIQMDEGVWDDMKAGYKKYAPAWAGGTPAAPAQGAKPAAPAAPKPPTGKSDPAVKALQDKLVAAGAKIKADGIMGPKTQAAMKQYPQAAAAQPAPATQSAINPETGEAYTQLAPTAAPGTPAAGAAFNQGKPGEPQMAQAAAAAPAGPATQSAINPETGEAYTQLAPTAAPGTPAAGAAFNQGKPGEPQMAQAAAAAPAGPATQSAINPETGEAYTQLAPTAAPAAGKPGETAQAQAAAAPARAFGGYGQAPAAAPTAAQQYAAADAGRQPVKATESTGFRSDELSRILNLVHHR